MNRVWGPWASQHHSGPLRVLRTFIRRGAVIFTVREVPVLRAVVVLGALLIVPNFPLGAQARGVLVGVVVDGTSGASLAGAVVSVINTDFKTVSDENGGFVVSDLGAGEITLRAELPGYTSVVEKIEVTPAEVGLVQIRLGRVEVVLEELVVVAQRASRRSGSSVAEIVVSDTDFSHTAADLLAEKVPGLEIRGQDGALGGGVQIRIRGATSISLTNDPAIYVDGALAYDGRSGSSFLHVLELIPASVVARIRVLRGPSAGAQFANASNGVILIETNTGGNR